MSINGGTSSSSNSSTLKKQLLAEVDDLEAIAKQVSGRETPLYILHHSIHTDPNSIHSDIKPGDLHG